MPPLSRAGAAQHRGKHCLQSSNLSDAETGTIGRRPSGARLYHRGSRFGEPERRKLDRNLVARILFLAEALDRRTRGKGQHGGLLKAKGLDVLRALLRRLLQLSRPGSASRAMRRSPRPPAAASRRCARSCARWRPPASSQTIRRKVVVSFVSRARRERFDFAVQTSNSYVFNLPIADRRAAWRSRAAAVRRQSDCRSNTAAVLPDAKFRHETSLEIKTNLPPDLAAALEGLGKLIGSRA